MRVLNFGSLNIDYIYDVEHFVRPGETISSLSRNVQFGGKGLNQSIAISKAGVPVYHAGAVGKEDGASLLSILKEQDVNIDFVKKLEDSSSGHAIISVNSNGENSIILYGGANKKN